MFAKIWFKNLRMKDSWSWIFGYDLRSKKALSISWLFQVGVLRHAWRCPKWQQIVSQFYLNNELSYEVSFFASGSNKSNTFNFLQVEVVRRVQSDSKQNVRFFTYRYASTERSNYSRDFQNFSQVLKFFWLQQTFMDMNYKFL